MSYADRRRIQDAWYIEKLVSQVANCSAVKKALFRLYGCQAKPFQTGASQATYSDSIHFNCEPFSMTGLSDNEFNE